MSILKFLKWIGLYNTGVPHTARQLASKVAARAHQAFRPAAQASYIRKFHLFVAYSCFIGIHLQNVTPVIAISFLEFLVKNNIFQSGISNYVNLQLRPIWPCMVFPHILFKTLELHIFRDHCDFTNPFHQW